MAQQELNFEYVGNQLTATIDNETLSLDMYKIIKAPTHFILYNNLDTVLDAPIEVDLFLGYSIDDDDIIGIEKGFVNLKLTSISGQTIYKEMTIDFINGQIYTQITNNLNIGEYILQVDYSGNKYYESTSLTIQFSISQREIKCIFNEDYLQAYPNDNINVGITLVDNLNGKKISNCLINYYFNGFKYLTQTNEQGYALLNITVPNVDPNEEIINDNNLNVIYFDYDGNIQYINNNTQFVDDGNESDDSNIVIDILESYDEEDVFIEYSLVPKYTLEIDIDSTIYKLVSDTYIDVFLKKYMSEISYVTTSDDYLIRVEGDVLSYNERGEVSNAQYGTVSFDISELTPHPQSTINIDDNGHFVFETEITQTENANVPVSEPLLYSPILNTKTTVSIVGDSNKIIRDYINEHKIGFLAQTTSSDVPVSYGMMTFIIMQDNNEIYRYVTEININGEASFYFDISTVGKYQIKAIYHGMFEYQGSESNLEKYEIIEGE